MGVHRIAHFLAANGHAHAEVVDSSRAFNQLFSRQGVKNDFDMVGISTLSGINFRFAAAKIDLLRGRLGDILMIAGGHGMKMDHDLLFGCFKVDIAVTGHGEFPMAEISASLSKSGSLVERFGHIRGISINDGGKAFMTPPRPRTQEDFEAVNDSFDFTQLPIRADGRSVSFEMPFSTHCPSICVYCSASSFDKGVQRKVIYYPVEKMLEKLNSFFDHQIKTGTPETFYLLLSDDNLTMDKERFFRILDGIDEIRKRTGRKIVILCLSRFECLTDELLERASRLGVMDIAVGVESRVPEILKFLKPGADISKLEGLEERMTRHGIRPTEFFIVAPPVATFETLLKTADDMLEMLKKGVRVKPFLRMETFEGSPAMAMGFRAKSIVLGPKDAPSMKAPYEQPIYFKNSDDRVEKAVDEIEEEWRAASYVLLKELGVEPHKYSNVMEMVATASMVMAIYKVLGINDKRKDDAAEVLENLKNDPDHYLKIAFAENKPTLPS
jgi:radical SAM superfamily enzyme YgiQ (UPF0313 family)